MKPDGQERPPCKAKSKRSGKQCRNQPIVGRETCRMHGGTSRIGPLNENYKHGLYSAYLPARFGELFKALEGRDLLDLTEDIKLLHTRLMDVAKRVDSGESGEKWKAALSAFERMLEADDDAHRLAATATLNEILKSGASDWAAWDKIEELVVKKTKVVESQRKRAVENQEMLTAQTVREMMRAIMEGLKSSVNEHVKDTIVRNAIFASASSEFTRLVGSRDRGLVETRNH